LRLDLAHLAFCAGTIFARASAVNFLGWGLDVATDFEPTGRPRFAGVVWPSNRLLAGQSLHLQIGQLFCIHG
jgi:hypothetical protein